MKRNGHKVGDRVHAPGQGLGRIEKIEEKRGEQWLCLQMDSHFRIWVPLSSADALWPLPTKEEARGIKAQLLQPSEADRRGWEERERHFRKIISGGSMDDYVDFTRRQFASGNPRSLGEKKLLETMVANVLAPIAEVLSEDQDELTQQVAAFHQEGALDS